MYKSVDHYLGQKVVNIGGQEKGDWYIELEGGVHIVNIDGRRTQPTGIIGMVFARLTLHEDDTTLVFENRDSIGGLVDQKTVEFDPAKYAIYDVSV